ncbi:Uncharacterized RING finger protein [Scale drop disease virus]|uniref:ORF_103L n=1 Tax=Scale drop disease virus TaxID=1697349 RepID=A0A0K1L6Y3_9VIRU|nr:ORF_103L [Scale drop disease virus]AKU37518.1 ORF_103L [Scale drop disease virus]QLI60776.1 Uncharacterized RING finger protein [Scale drop disease virus]QXJ13694.1 ORF103L [Scale drop disease virus]
MASADFLINDITCAVCLDIMTSCEVITCGHSLCSNCVEILFHNNRRVTCPLCRAHVTGHVKFLAYQSIVTCALNKIEQLTKMVSDGEDALRTMVARYVDVLEERDQLAQTNQQIHTLVSNVLNAPDPLPQVDCVEPMIIDDDEIIIID